MVKLFGIIDTFKYTWLQFHPDDEVALIALAKLHLMNDDLDQCQYTCTTLLRFFSQDKLLKFYNREA